MVRAIAYLSLVVLLTGCGGVLVAYKGPVRSDDEVAILDGYHRNYLIYLEEADISSVDGVQAQGVLGWDASARLLPGKHMVGVILQHYFGGGGGYTSCAFEDAFEAGRRYQIRPHSAHSEEPWYRHPPGAWWQTMGMEVRDKEKLLDTHQIRMICFSGTPLFCKEDKDCASHQVQKCEPVAGGPFGTCK